MGKTKFTIEPGRQDIISERTFNAPIDKVFEAFVNPDLIKQWWGGHKYETELELYEPKAGGSWKFVQTDEDGNKWSFHGTFHEVNAKEHRAIQTFEFDGLPEKGHVAMDTMVLTEEDGKTTMRTVSVFQSVADRDGMVASGMQDGYDDGMDVFASLVEQ